LILHPPPAAPLFPYTTLFRSFCYSRLYSHSLPCGQGWIIGRCYPHPNDARHSFKEEAERVILPVKEYSDSAVRLQRDKGLPPARSEEHTSELQSREKLVCRLL